MSPGPFVMRVKIIPASAFCCSGSLHLSQHRKVSLLITKKFVMGGTLRHNVVLSLKYLTCIPAKEPQFSSFSCFPSQKTFIQNICTPRCLQKIELDKKIYFRFKACTRKHGRVWQILKLSLTKGTTPNVISSHAYAVGHPGERVTASRCPQTFIIYLIPHFPSLHT